MSLILAMHITPCRIKDPKLNECFRNSFNHIIKNIRRGLRELNLPSLDPMYVEDPEPVQSNGFRVKYYDAFVRGLSKLNFTEVRSNVPVS